MGVDIALFWEVRHKKAWRPVIWQTPMELNSWNRESDEGKEWDKHLSFFNCRFYHFSDFIEDYGREGLPDDVSPEFKEEIESYESSAGYFSYVHLRHFCEQKTREMLESMLCSTEHQMIKQLNRIERYVKQKPITKTQMTDNCYYSELPMKKIYEEYQEEYGLFEQAMQYVNFLLYESGIFPYNKEIRILYVTC